MLTRSLLEALYSPQYQTPKCQGRVSRFRESVLRNIPTTYSPAEAVIIYANKHLSLEAQEAFAIYIIRGDVDDLINFSRTRCGKLARHHEDNRHDSSEASSSSSSSSSSNTLELPQAPSSIPPEVNEMPPLTATETIILFTAPASSSASGSSTSTTTADSDTQDIQPTGESSFKATFLSGLV